ncbi:restriction endonuclease subunit S [Puia dinghuensis]|uniref:Type I restriction-modification enzyme, S subunit n=1 Tax=Puia dinghuensis TaxID=1792502 RepID=A0A8J2UIW7_9BACT|nr:restriction endonuclease subunit S [Puia dinghuensis]GGB24790.1 type I restriction-modification enzyme, S subunit [Puia dinghuensis]
MSKINENRPGYKYTSFGWIPEEWDVKRLEDISEINPKRKVLLAETEVSFLAMADVSEEGKIVNQSIRNYKSVANGFTYFQDNDILVAKITPCFENGKGAIARNLKNGAGFGSTEFHVIRLRNKAIIEFIFYHTRLHSFLGRGEQNMVGSAGQKRIPKDYIETYKITLPPLPEQDRIVSILSTLDEAIFKTQQLVDLLKRRNKWMTQNLLTGRKRLPGFSNKWKIESLKNVAQNINIRNSQGLETSSLYGVTKKFGLIPMREHVKGESFKNCKIVRQNWFAYNPMRVNIGSIALWENIEEIMVSGDYVVFACNEDKLLPPYLNLVRETNLWENFMQAAGNGSVRIRIYFKELGQFNFPCPGREEQKKIIEFITMGKKELELYQQHLFLLQQQKKGLLQKLLTGEIRVKI